MYSKSGNTWIHSFFRILAMQGVTSIYSAFSPKPEYNIDFKEMVCVLKPEFAEEGTNEKKHQQDVYTIFLDYLKVVVSKSLTKFSTERDNLQIIAEKFAGFANIMIFNHLKYVLALFKTTHNKPNLSMGNFTL